MAGEGLVESLGTMETDTRLPDTSSTQMETDTRLPDTSGNRWLLWPITGLCFVAVFLVRLWRGGSTRKNGHGVSRSAPSNASSSSVKSSVKKGAKQKKTN